MIELTQNIKEIQEGGKGLANWYLNHGYILLDIQSASRSDHHPIAGNQQYYVRRNPIYVLGRPEGVAIAPPPPKWGPPLSIPNKPPQGEPKDEIRGL